MSDPNELLYPALKAKQQKGSKPRCHLITHGTKESVSGRLTSLVAGWATVDAGDTWMPNGFTNIREAQLHLASRLDLDKPTRRKLINWWLTVSERRTTTPNWDIASTCTIAGKKGLMLVEAKAHDVELRKEELGKPLKAKKSREISFATRRNHVRIGACIEDASLALSEQTKLIWGLSRDHHYQMANRFTWAWKLAEMEIPVVLVYLGFINCEEMRNGRQRPIVSLNDWTELVEDHSGNLFPKEVWNRELRIRGTPMIPLIRVNEQALTPSAEIV